MWGNMTYSSPAGPSTAGLEQQLLLQQQQRLHHAHHYQLQGRGRGRHHGPPPLGAVLTAEDYEQPQMARIEGIHGDRPQVQMASIDSHRPVVGFPGALEVLEPAQLVVHQQVSW